MPRYGLIGEKLGHSFSKPIHEALGGYQYELLPLAREELDGFLRAKDFAGLNVTIPYKQAVIPYLDELDARARAIGAVNTIVNRAGKLTGCNTDYDGFRQTLLRSGIDPAGKTCLILGNGGACRPAKAVLADLGAGEILVASRRPEDAGLISYAEAEQRPDVELLVNATPVGMFPEVGNCPIRLDCFPRLKAVVDLIYNPLRTELLLEAEARGIPAVNGLYMLVWQAKAAAERFLDAGEIPTERADAVYADLLNQKRNLVLTGMPMSGKSTIGRMLAARLGKRFVDTDAEIERRAGMTIPQIFERFTEAGFRKREQEVIRDLSLENGLILSTGGGAPMFPENVRNLRRNGWIVFLDRPLERLQVGEGRPLTKSPEEVAALFAKREPVYRTACDWSVPNAGTAAEAVERIVTEYDRVARS